MSSGHFIGFNFNYWKEDIIHDGIYKRKNKNFKEEICNYNVILNNMNERYYQKQKCIKDQIS